MSRIISILHVNDSMNDNVKNIVKFLIDNNSTTQLYVFTKTPDDSFNIANGTCTCSNVSWPDTCTTIPQIRNWINNFFKTNNFNGKLHVLEDTTSILKNPNEFINEIEHTMDILDYDVWFSTVCDTCNYVYSKYNPRLNVMLDKVEYFPLGLGNKLVFTSHSNTQWIIYNFSKVPDELLKFDESFTISMFYIIEYLARRRNTKRADQLYLMNQYMTVGSELGVFKALSIEAQDDTTQKIQEEDEKFKEKNVDYRPDNDIDILLELIYAKLNAKMGTLALNK